MNTNAPIGQRLSVRYSSDGPRSSRLSRVLVLTLRPVVALSLLGAAASGIAIASAAMPPRSESLHQASAATSRPLAIDDYFELEHVASPRISPEGEWVAYTVSRTSLEDNRSETRVWMASTAGGDALPMTAKGTSAGQPRWSPDGRFLSFLAARDGGKSQVWVLDRRGGEARQLTSAEESVRAHEWSPDGTRLALVLRDPEADEETDGEEETDADETAGGTVRDVPDPWVIDRLQFKRDYAGYLDRRRTHLYLFDVDSEEIAQVTSGDYDDGQPQWSPDGVSIAFVSNRTEEPDANYNSDIWLVAADRDPDESGNEPTRVTTNAGPDDRPSWHPDGSRLAHVTQNTPELIVYSLNKLALIGAGGGSPTVLSEPLDRNVAAPRFSPDGETVYFRLEDRGQFELASMPTSGGAVARLIDGERSVGAFDVGADGSVVAVVSEPHMPGNLFALGADGALQQITHHNDAHLAEIRLGDVEKAEFASADGTRVEAFITKPPDFEAGVRYPTILWIHGGPIAQYDWGFAFQQQLFAANGYVVVAPNPRGSSGYGVEFTKAIWAGWGTVDTEDVLAAVDHAVAVGYADPLRLGVGGWSYGGILTNYVITSTERFAGAISGASGALWVANYGHDQYQRWYEAEFGLPWENREIWENLSPFNRVQHITTPTMWVGGEKDWNVPIQNSEQMYQSMRRLGRETILVVYPNQHHGIDLPVYTKDLFERYLAWYDKYVKNREIDATE